ncbi:MAG: hypothetical protein JWO03_2831 [Bacteroidetes bacterium]|nr:hypothetical protein [Bacteroidota bacterium]
MTSVQIKKAAAAVMLCTAIVLAVVSCKKDNFDIPSPGANIDPAGVHATMTIKQFKQAYCVPNMNSYLPVMLTDSVIISGIVNADDRSGNFYKIISLQDSTGGIQIKVGSSYLYQDYPIGRRIFIKTKGLLFFNYTGTFELGGYIDTTTSTFPNVGAIVIDKAADHIIKGQWGLDIPVVHKTTAQLTFNTDNINEQSTLIQLDDMEFGRFDTTQTYADAVTKASVDRTVYDCSNYGVTVRSSGYANFASLKPNKGHGSIRGVYTYYSVHNVPQLILRDTSDIMFTNAPRCH